MILHEISTNVAEAIPFETFKEKIKIVKQELSKDRHVEIIDNKIIYSEKKWRDNNGIMENDIRA